MADTTFNSVNVKDVSGLKVGGVAITSTPAELNIMDGVTLSTGQINKLLQNVVAGKKVAIGIKTVGAASEDVPTGLTTVDACMVSMVGNASLTHMWSSGTIGNQTGQPAAGSIRIISKKPTSAADCTPVDAAGSFANVAWLAIGT